MPDQTQPGSKLRIAIGGDHAGYPLKQVVSEHLATGDQATLVGNIVDCGTDSTARCDYPDFAIAVAREILLGNADRGIVVCGSGVGVSVAANKIPGIRAAICHDTYSAHQGRRARRHERVVYRRTDHRQRTGVGNRPIVSCSTLYALRSASAPIGQGFGDRGAGPRRVGHLGAGTIRPDQGATATPLGNGHD